MNVIQIDKDWTLFLDRDGVINRRIPGDYIRTVEEFEFLPGVLKTLSRFSNIFHYLIIVTNQQGIGKGLMTEKDLQVIHQHMVDQIEKSGGRIDKIYFCSDLASLADNCRKPSPAMGLRAKKDFSQIDFEKSVMVGDSLTDIGFGRGLDMKTILIGDRIGFSGSDDRWEPDFILDDLNSVEKILRY